LLWAKIERKEPLMDLLSKLSEKWLERADANKANPGREDAFGDCADELNDALAKLQPVIEKLVEAGQAMRNAGIQSWPAGQKWDAALENWRKLSS
jgi:hypothetical protein